MEGAESSTGDPAPPPPAGLRARRLGAVDLAVLAGCAASLLTLLGFADGLWWGFDAVAQFRVQALVALAFFALVLGFAGRPRWALLFALATLPNAALVAPLYLGGEDGPVPAGPRLRVGVVNLHTQNGEVERARELILRHDPDVLLVMEVDEHWLAMLDRLADVYPHRVVRSRADNFGIALLGKLPLADARIVSVGPADVPSVAARVEVEGRAATIVGTHPLPPGGAEYTRLRDAQLAELPAFVEALEGRVMLLGDLNCTPWSSSFRRLVRETGLRDSAVGFGVQTTWPAQVFPLRIPLDHCLVSGGLFVADRVVVERFGSDHLPLFVDLVLTESP